MAIGDTWETINTYAFVAGETIITADYENDVVNDLQYLYTHPSSAVNVYSGNTNTNVTLGASTNDILAGLTLTFTPVQDKVLLCAFWRSGQGWDGTQYVQFAYQLGSGAITYINQDNSSVNLQMILTTITVVAGSSNTLTFYFKNTQASGDTVSFLRVFAIEMAN